MVFGCVDTVKLFGAGPFLIRKHPLTAIVVVFLLGFSSTVGFTSERPSAAKQLPTVISDV